MLQGVFGRWADLLGGADAAHATPEAQRMRAGRTGSRARCACHDVERCWLQAASRACAPLAMTPGMQRLAQVLSLLEVAKHAGTPSLCRVIAVKPVPLLADNDATAHLSFLTSCVWQATESQGREAERAA